MVGFEKALGAVKVIKDQIQYRSQSIVNLACGYFSKIKEEEAMLELILSNFSGKWAFLLNLIILP